MLTKSQKDQTELQVTACKKKSNIFKETKHSSNTHEIHTIQNPIKNHQACKEEIYDP